MEQIKASVNDMAGPGNTQPGGTGGLGLVHAAGRSPAPVGHAGHSSGCSASHPLFGLSRDTGQHHYNASVVPKQLFADLDSVWRLTEGSLPP